MTRRWFVAFASAVLGARMAPRGANRVPTRDGSTPERAILEDQWRWWRRELPDWRLLMQTYERGPNGTRIDHYWLESPAGDQVREVYFDVTHVHEATMHFIKTGTWPKGKGRR
jgi:hypothetical protein